MDRIDKMMKSLQNLYSAINPLAMLFLFILLIGTISRSILIVLYFDRIEAVDAFSHVILQGIRFDLVLLGMVLVPFFLAMPILVSNRRLIVVWRGVLTLSIPLLIASVLFLELATPSFIEQFDSRPNRIFFEYLDRPKEVLSTLWGAYRLPLMSGLTITAIVLVLAARSVYRRSVKARPVTLYLCFPVALVGVLASAMMGRSTLDHRPVNPSTVALTTDSMVNELALNSAYSVAYAAYELKNESKGGFRYSNMNGEKALKIVKDQMQANDNEFINNYSTWHKFSPRAVDTERKNLVLIVEESLGAEFVGSLGGLDLTPNIDALREEGWWFENLYATGTRSVRGLEAVTTGFLPTPARSVVKLSKSQRDFFTLASYLGEKGYDTSFIYGGEAQFDNMRRFFMGNGFQRVIDEKDYDNPKFVGSWGVSDEDLFERAHNEFRALANKPFFSLVFTSSNHTPFEFPDGKINIEGTQKQTVNNAVKYADYALGEFFKKAKTSNYWKNTVFLVIADHNSRVYGAELIPVKRFHIPAVIVGEGIKPKKFYRVASQIDMPPTLLSLIGVRGEHPMIGQDLTKIDDNWPGRAIMQFNTLQAYREANDVVVMQRGITPKTFIYENSTLHPSEIKNSDMILRAQGHSVWASEAYQKALY